MRHILYITIFLSILFAGGCTIVFKAKEIELDTESILSYELDHIDLFKAKELPYG